MTILFLIGFFIGVAMTAPVGSVNILCLRKTLNFGFFSGFFTALGAVFADMLFASIAIFSVGYISALIQQHSFWLQLIGGFIVVVFASSILWKHEPLNQAVSQDNSYSESSDYEGPIVAFLLTITNPGTVFGFIAFFSAMGKYVPPPKDLISSFLLLAGVLAGCTSWWGIVAAGASYYRQKISQNLLSKINIITGFIMLAFGFVLISRVLIKNIDVLIY